MSQVQLPSGPPSTLSSLGRRMKMKPSLAFGVLSGWFSGFKGYERDKSVNWWSRSTVILVCIIKLASPTFLCRSQWGMLWLEISGIWNQTISSKLIWMDVHWEDPVEERSGDGGYLQLHTFSLTELHFAIHKGWVVPGRGHDSLHIPCYIQNFNPIFLFGN